MPITYINAREVGFRKTLPAGGLGNFTTLQSYCEQVICRQMPITEVCQVTVSNSDFVLIDSSMIDGILAIGTSTTSVDGGIACAQLVGDIGTAATTVVTDSEGNIWNNVNIIDSGTHDNVLTADGRVVFGLIQCSNLANDGDAIGAALGENTQMSFVYYDSAGILQLTAINTTIQFDYARVEMRLNQPDKMRVVAPNRIDFKSHFSQAFTNVANVVVNHNLNKYPAVVVFNNTGVEIFCQKTYNSLNQVTLDFSENVTGVVACI